MPTLWSFNDDRISLADHDFHLSSKYDRQSIHTYVISCPNPECRELTVKAWIRPSKMTATGIKYDDPWQSWNLSPLAQDQSVSRIRTRSHPPGLSRSGTNLASRRYAAGRRILSPTDACSRRARRRPASPTLHRTPQVTRYARRRPKDYAKSNCAEGVLCQGGPSPYAHGWKNMQGT